MNNFLKYLFYTYVWALKPQFVCFMGPFDEEEDEEWEPPEM